jgi:hypothetical protein
METWLSGRAMPPSEARSSECHPFLCHPEDQALNEKIKAAEG